MTGQAVEIPWAPGANYTRIICRLGEPRPDGADVDEHPDLMTQGGSVTLTCAAKKIRYAEEDGRSRMLTTRAWTFKVRLSDGELYNPESGNVGVKILSGSSAGVDPAGFTWTATVTPDNGESWSCTIPPTAGATFDLVSNAEVVAPNPGESTLSARVAALEASSGGWSVADATTTVKGIVELATTAEATIGTDTTRAVTPLGVAAAIEGAAFAAPLGADDNYVTDAEKVKLANLSGTNTGDQVLPTWSTLSSKPAVIAAGATQADARTAIGAGTSNLAIGTTGTTAKAGNYTPPDATASVKGLVQLAGDLGGTATAPTVVAASATVAGKVELATTAEATTGTDSTRAVTPAGLKAVADTKAAGSHTHDDRYVRTVNGTGPDAAGNVAVSGGESAQSAIVTVPNIGWTDSTTLAVAGLTGPHIVAPVTAEGAQTWAAGQWWASSPADGQLTITGTIQPSADPVDVRVVWWE